MFLQTRRRRWGASLVLLATVAVAAARHLTSRDVPPAAPQIHPAPVTVTALARLEPEGAIIDVGVPAGTRVDRFEAGIHESARVRRGDVLAYLDTYAEAAAARDHAASELEEARLRIRRAEQTLPLGIEAQNAERRRAEAELERLRADLQRADQLRAGGAILQNQYDATAAAVREAEESVRRNEALLAQLEEDRDLQLQGSRAAIRSTQAGPVRGELSARVQTLTHALTLAEARLELTRVRAPSSGEILQIVTRPGEAIHGQPLLRMGDTDVMVAIADVYETDVQFVRVGQPATVKSAAFTQTVTGVVQRIGRLIQPSNVIGIDPTAAADKRVIEVRIRLDSSTTASRLNGHQVDVAIDTRGSGTPAVSNPASATDR